MKHLRVADRFRSNSDDARALDFSCIRIACVLFLCLLVSCDATADDGQSGGASTKTDLQVQLARGPAPGTLSLQITISAASDVKLYSWDGAIYPMLGRGLTIDVRDQKGGAHSVESVEVVLPKFPHKDDSVVTRLYTYSKPLIVRVADVPAGSAGSCFDVVVEYDSRGERFAANGFSTLHLRSNSANICID